MSRYIVVVFLYFLASLPSVAQTPDERSIEAAQKSADYSRHNTGEQTQGMLETRVSITRLRVPRKARQLYEKAVEKWQRQKRGEAERYVLLALKIDPTFPDALALHGFIQASVQQWGSAEESLKTAVQNDPGYSSAYVILAGIYNTQARYDEAHQATEEALSAGANSWSVQYEIARALIGKGKYENALAITNEALHSKHGTLLHVAKAHALLGLRRYPEAATELKNYLRYQPSGEASDHAHAVLDRLQRLMPR